MLVIQGNSRKHYIEEPRLSYLSSEYTVDSNGDYHGTRVTYNERLEVSSIQNYKHGKYHGRKISYNCLTGNHEYTWNYYEGKRHGLQITIRDGIHRTVYIHGKFLTNFSFLSDQEKLDLKVKYGNDFFGGL